ncbi:MAG: zinc ribbon domain-containing protein [Chloroflexota bacterium]
MPFYEFKCQDCLSRFELSRSIAQRDAPATCPHCEGIRCNRLISLPMAYSRSSDGSSQAIGGSSCSSCAATTCAGCSVRH